LLFSNGGLSIRVNNNGIGPINAKIYGKIKGEI